MPPATPTGPVYGLDRIGGEMSVNRQPHIPRFQKKGCENAVAKRPYLYSPNGAFTAMTMLFCY